MANNAKKYIITAVTLGVIAAASAGIIGLTNLLTAKQIAANEQKRFNAGIVAIFGENASVDTNYKNEANGKYIQEWYWVNMGEGVDSNYIFKTTGSNMYGKISLLVGFDSSKDFKGTYTLVNEQTYASTLVENYLVPLNGGNRDLDDVTCGATYGAKLVRDMVKEAQEYCNGIIVE